MSLATSEGLMATKSENEGWRGSQLISTNKIARKSSQVKLWLGVGYTESAMIAESCGVQSIAHIQEGCAVQPSQFASCMHSDTITIDISAMLELLTSAAHVCTGFDIALRVKSRSIVLPVATVQGPLEKSKLLILTALQTRSKLFAH